MSKIFIVEDEKTIREELSIFLSRYGYEIEAPENFENIIEDIKKSNSDLILLDINLPIFDGYYICREVRKFSETPIIVVTSRDSDIDELMSMNLGADDFVTKPYNTQILLARIEVILKRVNRNLVPQDVLEYKDMKVNLSNGTVNYNDKTIEITKNELKILSYLIKNKGKIVSRENLMNYLWDCEMFIDDNTLSVNVTRIRRKLEEIGLKNIIETRRRTRVYNIMSIITFIKERMIFLIVNLIMFLLIGILMKIADVPINIILILFFIWFGPVVIYMFLEFIKYNRYLKNLTDTIDGLDRKYLLPEIINEPRFQEERIINEVLKECNKSMHENVKYYKDEQIEYREYIETWVHEIKTPIASAKLILENDDSNLGSRINYEMKRVEGFIEQVYITLEVVM